MLGLFVTVAGFGLYAKGNSYSIGHRTYEMIFDGNTERDYA